MFTPIPMQKMRIIVLKRDADAVTEALGHMGAMELTRVQGSAEQTNEQTTGENVEKCQELQERLECLVRWLGVDLDKAGCVGETAEMGMEAVDELLHRIEEEARPAGKRLNELDVQIRDVQATLEQIAPYRDLRVVPEKLREATLLYVAAGDLPEERIPSVREELPTDAVLVPIGSVQRSSDTSARLRRVLALSSRRSRFALHTVLEKYQFEEDEIPSDWDTAPAVIYEKARKRLDKLMDKRAELQKPLQKLGDKYSERLQCLQTLLKRELQISEAERHYGTTWATVIITGWCPREQAQRIKQRVEEATSGTAIIEISEATREDVEREDVPSWAELPAVLRPFQRMVHGFGVPGYREIEPTLLFAISFLLMFGMIFGDLGHGLCLLGVGLVMYLRGKSEDIRDGGYLVAAGGLASVLFGAFFQGSFFGYSLKDMGWRFTLGLEPLKPGAAGGGDVVRYMLFALVFGIMLITLGVILNIIIRLRAGDIEGGLFGRFGLAGFIFYWGGLGLVFKAAFAGWSPSDVWIVLFLVGLPLFVLAFHGPVYALLSGRRPIWEESFSTSFFEGVIEMFEVFITYLANTFSFLRIAAFALSHVALCFTIFILQDIVSGLPAGVVWSAILFVIGTALIIGLEGFIVAIQIFRLEYYEFFTKFFRGEGRRFRPFQIAK